MFTGLESPRDGGGIDGESAFVEGYFPVPKVGLSKLDWPGDG